MFLVESVVDSAMGGDSIRDVYQLVRTYFREYNQAGEISDRNMQCRNRTAILDAIDEFVEWASNKAHEEPKWLWISLHGNAPESSHYLGTNGLTAAHDVHGGTLAREVLDWKDVFKRLYGNCPPNVVMVMDVCWGGSPSAPAALSSQRGRNPALMFGPIRTAHRIELNTAAALITAAMIKGTIPSAANATELVSHLNRWFPPDPVTGKEFYRVWYWNGGWRPNRFPKPNKGIKRAI